MEIITCDPCNIYTTDHPDFAVCSFMGNSIGLKRAEALRRQAQRGPLVKCITEKKYFSTKAYGVGTQKNRLNETPKTYAKNWARKY